MCVVCERSDHDVNVNLFECTIRVLGGLLSAYALTSDATFLSKAVDLADRLLPAFETRSGLALSDVNLHTHRAKGPHFGPDSSTAETTTVQLEFRQGLKPIRFDRANRPCASDSETVLAAALTTVDGCK